MKPFWISDAARSLSGPYPPADTLRRAAEGMSQQERTNFLRLWVSEGIPYAFRDAPMFYEATREWLARKLEIRAKEITLIGSARIGYSLRKGPAFGNPFGPSSDLDISAIAVNLFEQLCQDFAAWKDDWDQGIVHATGEKEESYWTQNLVFVPNNISKGFISAWLVPARECYPVAQRIGQTMYELQRKLDSTPGLPKFRKATIRVYRDWPSFEKQITVNFSFAVSSFQTKTL